MNHIGLPSGYVLSEVMNVQENKKLAVTIAGVQAGIVIVSVLSAVFFFPFSDFVSFSRAGKSDFFRLILLIPCIFVYMAAHELVHSLLMRILGKKKPSFGFSGLYMYAESGVFFDRKSFCRICIAPFALFFVLLFILTALTPHRLFWFFHILQIINAAAAAGDLYSVLKAKKSPESALFRIYGYKTEIYCEAEIIKEL